MISKYQFTITYEASVNTDTGEILETKIVSKTDLKPHRTKSSKPEEDDEEPKLYLEENKYRLNHAAIEMMGLNPDDKIDIKYEESNGNTYPIIGNDEVFQTHSGNRLTKSLTVAFRGNKNIELSKFGTTFNIVAHPTKEGLFVLEGDKTPEIKNTKENEDVQINEEDLSLEELIDDKDAQVSEIDSNFFDFNL